jgi:hypothetical protein
LLFFSENFMDRIFKSFPKLLSPIQFLIANKHRCNRGRLDTHSGDEWLSVSSSA